MPPAQPAIALDPDYVTNDSDDLWFRLTDAFNSEAPDNDELPYEDGIPLESNWHRLEMNLLIELVEQHWQDRHDFFVGGNMFIYFDARQARNQNFRGPDFFLVKGTRRDFTRKSWVVWKENNRFPNVIVELASESTITTDLTVKKKVYEETFQTPEYFCYDPDTLTLYGWRLQRGRYTPISADTHGRMFSQEMGLWIGPWTGEHLRCQAVWLRLFTAEGELVPTFSEAANQRAEAANQRAEAEARRANQAIAELSRLKALLKAEV